MLKLDTDVSFPTAHVVTSLEKQHVRVAAFEGFAMRMLQNAVKLTIIRSVSFKEECKQTCQRSNKQ